MYEAVCQLCEGTGKAVTTIVIGDKVHDKCPVCDGSGIATIDEAEEFDVFVQKETERGSGC